MSEDTDGHSKQSADRDWLELALKGGDMAAWHWDLDQEDPVIFRTENYNRMLGMSPNRPWTYNEWKRHIHPQDHAEVVAKMQAVIDGFSPEYEMEYRVIRDDWQIRWVHARGKSVRDAYGKVTRIAGISRDITESKKLRRNQEQFVATLSHDLRNPLAAARANAELLQKYPDRMNDRTNLLGKVIIAIERTDRIIRDLLDASRAQADQPLHLPFEDCDLQRVFLDATADLTIQYGDRFRFEGSGDFTGNWPCDAIRRVLDNLASNAVKYGTKATPVTVKLVRNGGILRLSVHNEGNPLPREDQERLFEPYHRTRSAVESGRQGWGLGLTFIRSVAEALHGRVVVESGPEIGTTFSLEFPESAADSKRAAG